MGYLFLRGLLLWEFLRWNEVALHARNVSIQEFITKSGTGMGFSNLWEA
jgi:hypothetical protein